MNETKREYEKVKTLLENFTCDWKQLGYRGYNNDMYCCRDLREAYASFSWAKQQAYNYCNNLSLLLYGWGDCIPSHNVMRFTYNFRFELFGVQMYAYITKSYNRIGFYGMDRKEGIEQLAKNWQLYYQDYEASYEEIYSFQTLLNKMLGKRNKALRDELRENGII